MEQFGLALISIILIALGIAFVFAELESDEAEFFWSSCNILSYNGDSTLVYL